jgi:microcystin-dependent protein
LASAVGTDRDAARADHVHAHADLAGVVTTHHDAVQVEVNLTVPTDWLAAHANLAPTLDEIGARLNTAIVPSPVHINTPSVGTNLEAAHADHVHAHGDLTGVVTTHHEALQVEYNPAITGNWDPQPTEAKGALDQLAARVAPPGSILFYGGAAAPTGWLLCDGSTLDASADTTLVPLYNAILTTFGGTGVSNFNLPDLRGRTPIGVGAGEARSSHEIEALINVSHDVVSFAAADVQPVSAAPIPDRRYEAIEPALIVLNATEGDQTALYTPGRTLLTAGATNAANNGTFTVKDSYFLGSQTNIQVVETTIVNEGASLANSTLNYVQFEAGEVDIRALYYEGRSFTVSGASNPGNDATYTAEQATWNGGKTEVSVVATLINELASPAVALTKLTSRSLGDSGGKEEHQLAEEEVASHTHYYRASEFINLAENNGGLLASSQFRTSGRSIGDQSHDTMQPFLALNGIIKK